MKALLDTCAFIWLAEDPARLSEAAAQAINDEGTELFLSDVTIWEIALKYRAGKLPLPAPPRIWIPKQVQFFQLARVSIETDSILGSGELPPVHADPFDRLIAAQALCEPFRLISPDKPFRSYGVSCIW